MTRALALAGFVLIFANPVAEAVTLASHRVVYDVTLDHTTGSNIVAAHGRMAVEFKDVCDGWSTKQRLIADMSTSEGTADRTDFFVTAWESKDGRTMRFDVSDSRNGKAVTRERGSAALDADGSGRVELVANKPMNFALPKGTEFPTRQVEDILENAGTGTIFQKHIVFQGGDETNLEFSTAVIAGKPDAAAVASDRRVDAGGLLQNTPAWSALISFFPRNARVDQPDYEISTHIFANGINGSMLLIYPSYTLRAKLVHLEPLAPDPQCGSDNDKAP